MARFFGIPGITKPGNVRVTMPFVIHCKFINTYKLTIKLPIIQKILLCLSARSCKYYYEKPDVNLKSVR